MPKKTPTPKPETKSDKKPPRGELGKDQLDKVAGGSTYRRSTTGG